MLSYKNYIFLKWERVYRRIRRFFWHFVGVLNLMDLLNLALNAFHLMDWPKHIYN
jgi:hypothetical protein